MCVNRLTICEPRQVVHVRELRSGEAGEDSAAVAEQEREQQIHSGYSSTRKQRTALQL